MGSATLLVVLLGLFQEGPSSQKAAETVAAVRIDASPEDAARLAHYVEIKPGDVLRQEAVRHAVELLFATGEFEDVLVEAHPAKVANGIELVFRPIGAPFLKAVEIVGDRLLKPSAILEITKLHPGEPLWSARLDQAAQDVAVALTKEGYLEAQATADARRVPKGADAVFSIKAGPKVRVGRVDLQGVDAGERTLVGDLLRPGPGEVYRQEKAQQQAEEIRKRLARLGRWRAAVTPLAPYDPASGRVSLSFAVDPGPALFVEFRGARPPASLRKTIENLLRDGALRPDVLDEASERLEAEYQRHGYRDVSASHQEEPRPGGKVAVVYDIRLGEVAHVASVRIVGAETLTPAPLLATGAGAVLEDRTLEEDRRRLVDELEKRGYSEARVEIEVPDGGGSLPVVFRARPGAQTIVRAVGIESPVPLPKGTSLPTFRLQEGEPYRIRDLVRDRAELVAAYRAAGYLSAEVTHLANFSADKTEASVRLKVNPGPQSRIDRIVIAGLEATREEVVRRELQVKEGEPLAPPKVLESQRRLGALGVFQKVNISEMDPESVDHRSLVVTVEEAPQAAVAYSIGASETDLVRGSVEVTRRNLFGMDRTLSTFARFSFRGSRFLTTFREPYLLGKRQELFVTAFREDEERPNLFNYVRYGGIAQTARSLSLRWSAIMRYTFQATQVSHVQADLSEIDRQYTSYTLSGPSLSIVNDTRDDPIDPHQGRFLGADFQLSHRLLGGDSFVKGFLQSSVYQSLGPRVVAALGGRIGLARTLGLGVPQGLPLPERFFAGGDDTLRGFERDTAGPQVTSTSGKLVPAGGNALVLANAELRIDLWGGSSRGAQRGGNRQTLALAVFSDVGNVYPLVSNINLSDLRYTAGIGLRYKSPFGPIRLDWGFKLNRRDDEPLTRLHPTIGNAF